ncbi:hypothetical protein [Psychromonas sp. KJ10-2]|uniref:hypothetical protein n=1 Tax=Psychromonas sp. KJ10-2 TaxID=3391822 RepID=UPI0039B3F167
MKIQLLTAFMTVSLLVGCQSTGIQTTENIPSKNIPPKTPDLSLDLEGSKHRVWKEASFKGIRSELKEGEIIIFKDVESRALAGNSGYYYLGHIYSTDGQLLFDKKHALSDVGVINFKNNKIRKDINPEVVDSDRGVRYHGDATVHYGFSTTYWKTTGGGEPKAIPVRDYKSSSANIHKVAENDWRSLRLNCIAGNIYVGFSNDKNIYAADNEDITVTVFHPYSKGKEYSSKASGHTGVFLKVDDYIERILLEESAIKLVAFSHSNRNFTELTAYNNGLAEAYSRVKNNCTKD